MLDPHNSKVVALPPSLPLYLFSPLRPCSLLPRSLLSSPPLFQYIPFMYSSHSLTHLIPSFPPSPPFPPPLSVFTIIGTIILGFEHQNLLGTSRGIFLLQIPPEWKHQCSSILWFTLNVLCFNQTCTGERVQACKSPLAKCCCFLNCITLIPRAWIRYIHQPNTPTHTQ